MFNVSDGVILWGFIEYDLINNFGSKYVHFDILLGVLLNLNLFYVEMLDENGSTVHQYIPSTNI